MKRLISIFLALVCLVFVVNAADAPENSVITLARILSGKGTITPEEFERVQTAGEHESLGVLASILQSKGVLGTEDVARLALPVRPQTPRTEELAKSDVPAAAVVPSPVPNTSGPAVTGIPVTTKKSVPVSLYGTMLFTTGYNTANFNFVDVPMAANKQGSDALGDDKNFYGTVRQSRFGMNLDPINALGGKLTGTFEFDMMGGQAPYPSGITMHLFRMRLAYGRMDWKNISIEAGQDWSVFSPLNPTSLNEFGIPEFTSSGNAWARVPQLRLEAKTTKPGGAGNWLWQFAVSDPNMGDYPAQFFSANRTPGIGERGRMPALESRVAWTKTEEDRKFVVGLSGKYGRGKNSGTINNNVLQTGVDSWGVALDYSIPFNKWVNLSGEAYEGRALGVYAVAIGEAIGNVGTTGEHGVESRGGWAQLQFNWNKQWQTNLAYGLDVPNASQLPVGNRSRNQQYMANIIKKLTNNISASVEYRRIFTDYRNQSFANEAGDHVDLGVTFSF
jgi:hypothetical protein